MLSSIVFANFCVLANGTQNVLAIIGPVDAFEGEDVEFTVTLNGEPVQAKVTFEDLSSIRYSNRTTGNVTFTMPSVPYEGRWYTVTARIPDESDELYATHSILVKNTTGLLEIKLPAYPVLEMQEFTVTIKRGSELVSEAEVWFNSSVFITDSSGMVTLTAPDVLVTTNYGIFVNKTEYASNSTIIAINEAGVGQKLMEIIAPYVVKPGEENIKVNIIDKNGALENVAIELYYESEKQSTYITDSNGEAYITVPQINNDNHFLLYLTKDGYDTYGGDKEIKVSLLAHDSDHDLDIQTISSEIFEGNLVTVEVVDEVGAPVEGVTIWKEDVELDDKTDSEGIAIFVVPLVFMDKEYFIYAIKEGYNFAEEKITIRNVINKEQLSIVVENIVNEAETFNVTIKDAANIPIQGSTVVFNADQKLTDSSGNVAFVAPNVKSDTFYSIEATKNGYLPASASIEVINVDVSNGVSSKTLHICVAPHVIKNEEFTVTIRDENDYPVYNVRVTFMDTSLHTDFMGVVEFTAPDVSWDTRQSILVTKSGYESSSTNILIINNEGFQYWFILIAVVIILIIGIIVYFRYGQYMI